MQQIKDVYKGSLLIDITVTGYIGHKTYRYKIKYVVNSAMQIQHTIYRIHCAHILDIKWI